MFGSEMGFEKKEEENSVDGSSYFTPRALYLASIVVNETYTMPAYVPPTLAFSSHTLRSHHCDSGP